MFNYQTKKEIVSDTNSVAACSRKNLQQKLSETGLLPPQSCILLSRIQMAVIVA